MQNFIIIVDVLTVVVINRVGLILAPYMKLGGLLPPTMWGTVKVGIVSI